MIHPDKENEPTLTLAEISEGRARIYQWFSQQFSFELTDLQWQAVTTGQLSPFFELLAENGLATEVNDYVAATEQLAADAGPQARIMLASDFAHAFLLSGKDSALPYAGAYDANAQGMLHGATAEIMKQFLEGSGLALAQSFKEPEDHLAIYLAVLSYMADKLTEENAPAALAEQKRFIDEALAPWLVQFVAKCQGLRLQSNVYPALARLLGAFVEQDQRFLKANSTVIAEK